ncbi:hypothetical protein BXY41_106192 [Lacrimispora xylanisolvens]|uniref:Uncharacterized protein n=1 Tax=Lacrimispora xylanisolvens TaxID=384636 RepID=A0A2S6HSD7_9FIRM|nr:DUF1878 domain-containing protein [Hungatella xylanolytica]PPK80602.1 hypothetical protein BXY41_106192 [Hungatella xylanolytica]
MDIQDLIKKYEELEVRVSQLEFREELLRVDTNVNGILLDYNVSREQYAKIMDIMDEMRNKLNKSEAILNHNFEKMITDIFGGEHKAFNRSMPIEYHFCESLAKAFMDDGRWEEVFPALYGDMKKYQYLKEKNND